MGNKVLIIEDSASFSTILKQLVVDTHGYEVDVAETKAAASEMLNANADDYFISIVDLHLPDAPNGEALDMVVRHRIPALVFTGTADEATEEDLWVKGIADYAHKSGAHSLEYVIWKVQRILANRDVKVLVADDSRVARRNMERLLKIQCFQVFSAESGEGALEILEANPDIRIAILDGHMDGIDGFEVASKIRETHSQNDMEIIGVSSQAGRSVSAKFIKSGADDFLLKPFSPEEFFCRVNSGIERIEAFQKLKELNEVKNRFLGTAAHDIRGPISAIKTAADFMLKRDVSPERARSFLEMIRNNSTDMLDLLGSLLDVSAIESGKFKLNLDDVDFSRLIESRVDLYLPQAEAKAMKVEATLQESVTAPLDEVKIKQVVDNLLTNAIKYTPHDGTIQVDFSSDGETLVLEVRDSGPGISEEDQARLFTPYGVLSTPVTGGESSTGLGLAIAKNIIEAHEGKVAFENNENGGACFSVQIPILKK